MNHKLTIKVLSTTGLFVVLSFFFHEVAHYIMGRALGYDMTMTLNTVILSEGEHKFLWHEQLIGAAGPIFTILTAIIFFALLKKKDNIYLYLLLFMAFIQRLLAAVISFFNANDEARISEYLRIGKMTLPIIVSLSLFGLVYIMAKKYKYNWKFNLISFFAVCLFITAIVLTDQYIIKPIVYN